MLATFLSIVVSFAVALGVALALARLLPRWQVLDVPNERSSHQVPVPRGGGVAVLVGLAAGTLCSWFLGLPLSPRGWALGGATAMVAAVGLWDDLSKAPWWARLAVHFLAAAWVVVPVGGLERLPLPAPLDLTTGIFAVPLALVWVVGLVNMVNFTDGIDGIVGLQILVLGLAVAGVGGDARWLGWALAAACLGFLWVNWHPAKLFLGDVGSGALGFLAGALPFASNLEARSGALLVGVVLFVPLADTSSATIRRTVRLERLSVGHRTHAYQRLVDAGYSHSLVAGAIGAAALVLAGLAVWAYRVGSDPWWWFALAVGVALYLCELLWSRRARRA